MVLHVKQWKWTKTHDGFENSISSIDTTSSWASIAEFVPNMSFSLLGDFGLSHYPRNGTSQFKSLSTAEEGSCSWAVKFVQRGRERERDLGLKNPNRPGKRLVSKKSYGNWAGPRPQKGQMGWFLAHALFWRSSLIGYIPGLAHILRIKTSRNSSFSN
jgi:hypothetical protein